MAVRVLGHLMRGAGERVKEPGNGYWHCRKGGGEAQTELSDVERRRNASAEQLSLGVGSEDQNLRIILVGKGL